MLRPLALLALLPACLAFAPTPTHLPRAPTVSRTALTAPHPLRTPTRKTQVRMMAFPDFMPADEIALVEDPACVAMAGRLQLLPTDNIPTDVASGGSILTSCVGPEGGGGGGAGSPVVLLHGFDSSCLEYRRLLPLLEESGAEAWAVDMLGWGFTQRDTETVLDFSPYAKREHLRAFIEQHAGKGRKVMLVGASLGGSVAIDMALNYPELIEKLVLIDAQGYIDGAAMTGQPRFLQEFGVKVLKSKPLRMFANKIAYSDPDTFGTEDAMRIGRLHTLTGGWEDAMIGFMNSGGYQLSGQVSRIPHSTLVMWGRNDKILDPAKYAERFIEDLGDKARLQWVEDCGHVPHLEQAAVTANAILEFAGVPVKAASA